MKSPAKRRLGHSACRFVAACILVLGAASVSAGALPGAQPLTALEEAFWACDYIGTTHGVAEAPVPFCVEVTYALQHEKFGGDFDALVAWWRDRKPLEHARAAARARAPVSVVTAPGADG